MIKKKIKKKDNVINFPTKLSSSEKEVEAIVFAAAEPLDIATIENKISKKTDVEKILLKLQLKKLELIRLLSQQMLKRKRLGREIRFRGSRSGIRPIYNSELKVNLFELLKTYSTIIMTKDFQKINIPKLPVFTTEEGIKTIKEFFGKLIDWKKLDDLIPKNFKKESKYKRTGKAGIFAGSLELVKEGNLRIKQDNLFDDIYVKENK